MGISSRSDINALLAKSAWYAISQDGQIMALAVFRQEDYLSMRQLMPILQDRGALPRTIVANPLPVDLEETKPQAQACFIEFEPDPWRKLRDEYAFIPRRLEVLPSLAVVRQAFNKSNAQPLIIVSGEYLVRSPEPPQS
jgi:hypothetical protein